MIYNNVLELIGNTPLVKYKDNICLKLEYFNPSSSIKDRASYSMIKEAMTRGEINQDTVIIEPTSGNTGIGLAMVCAVLGLKLIICMPENMSVENFVLGNFKEDEKEKLDKITTLAAEAIEEYLKTDITNAQNKYNKKHF